jgi:hypothetical protein
VIESLSASLLRYSGSQTGRSVGNGLEMRWRAVFNAHGGFPSQTGPNKNQN